MNKFKKSSKAKSLTFGIAILSSAAIVSTGFAAWVITGGAEASVSGTITADTVERKDHKITIGSNLESIYFGAPATMDIANAWLSNSGETETLILTKTFTVANVDTKPTNDNIGNLIDGTKTKLEESTETAEANKYSKAATDGYVAALPEVILGSTDPKKEAVGIYINPNSYSGNTATFDLKIVFGWGSEFGNINPYLYFNAKDATETNKAAAETGLSAVHNINTSFKLTIVTK